MAHYKVSEITKSKILTEARKLFYENGYKKTSCAMIAEAAGVNVASINYHFGGKANMSVQIFNDITFEIRELLKKKIVDAGYEYESLVEIMIESRVIHDLRRKSAEFRRFFIELCYENVILSRKNIERVRMESFTKDYGVDSKEVKKDYILYAINSLINGMTIVSDQGLIDETEYNADKIIEMFLRILDVEKSMRREVIDTSREIFEKISFQIGRDFICE